MRSTYFPALAVAVKDGQVSTAGGAWALSHPVLGPLAGSQAVITDGTSVHRVAAATAGALLAGPVGLLPGLTKKQKASVIIVFPDGTTHEKRLNGNGAVRRGQAEVVQYNALAATATITPRPVADGQALMEKLAKAKEGT